MLNEIKKVTNLCYNIVVNPVRTINSERITDYNAKVLRVFYYFVSLLPIFQMQNVYAKHGFSLHLFLIAVVYLLIGAILNLAITFILYYAIFRFTKEVKITLEQTAKLLFPIIATSSLLIIICWFTFFYLQHAKLVIGLLESIWFNLMIFIVIKFRFNQNFWRSILMVLPALIINIALVLLDIYRKQIFG